MKINKLYIFPIILLTLLIALSALKISGSSIGIFHSTFYGESIKDPNLIKGQPRGIRSDEWLVNTQLALAQHNNDFKPINDNFNGGMDMTVVGDAPYREWSAIFKPYNLSFLILPFENAFAFRWWFHLTVLMLSAYLFCLRLFPKRILFSSLFAMIIGFTPFVAWWYLVGTIVPITCGFLLMVLGMSVIDQKTLWLFGHEFSHKIATLLKVLALSYVGTVFAMTFYPPFQIPIMLSVAFFLFGYFLESTTRQSIKKRIISILPIIYSAVISGIVLFIFLVTRKDTITAITGTVYPAHLSIPSGGGDIKRFLASYLQPQIQRIGRGENYLGNQSEASNFLVPSFFFLIPSLIILGINLYRKASIRWTLLMLTLCNLVFIGNLYIHIFDPISKLLLLNKVSHDRIAMGVGFLGAVTMLWFIKEFTKLEDKPKYLNISLVVYAAIYFVFAVFAGIKTREQFPHFITNGKLILGLSIVLIAGMSLLLTKYNIWGVATIALFGFISVYNVNPLYRGMGPVANNRIIVAMDAVSDPNDKWGVVDTLQFESFPEANGFKSVSGVALYPNLKFWRIYVGQDDERTYNRYAHIALSDINDDVQLLQTDAFFASVRCDKKLTKNIDYLLSPRKLNLSCAQEIKTIRYPNLILYIYKMKTG